MRSIDVLLTANINSAPSEEEISLLLSYKNQISDSFQTFKKMNLLISMQEDELFKAKEEIFKRYKEFNLQKEVIYNEIQERRDCLKQLKKDAEQLIKEKGLHQNHVNLLEIKCENLLKCQEEMI